MGYSPEDYLKEAVRNLEKFKDSLSDKLRELEDRMKKLENK